MRTLVRRAQRAGLRCGLVNTARVFVLAFTTLLINAADPAIAQDVTLQVDGYVDGQTAGFQGGFVAGEIGAVRLTPPGPFPMQVKQVLFLFGGAPGQHQVILRIYDDSASTLDPVAELFSNSYLATASSTVFQSVDLTGDNVLVTGPVRVGIEMTHAGFPSIARDDDGDINRSLNFIMTGSGWVESQTFGLTGDWVIRAVVGEETVPTQPLTWGRIKSMHGN
jgi:hypothetical protein